MSPILRRECLAGADVGPHSKGRGWFCEAIGPGVPEVTSQIGNLALCLVKDSAQAFMFPILFFGLIISPFAVGQVPASYKGKPYNGASQVIPGKIKAVLYDVGGEGVAYHDADPAINNGTKCCGNTFRSDEGVDINQFHNHDHTLAGPLDLSDHYVGWLEQGEWLRYTVKVNRSGSYRVVGHLSCKLPDSELRILVSDIDVSGPIRLEPTGAVHTWNMFPNLAKVKLKKGIQVMTIQITKLQKGTTNLDYLEFVPE